MPLFMDQHDTEGASPIDLARAHVADLEIQDSHGVRFLTYWMDYHGGVTNCLVEAPDPDAVNRAHAASHGDLAGRVIPVDEGEVLAFLGRTADPAGGPIDEPATRTIVFTDIVGSTSRLEELGDDAALQLLRSHNALVRRLLADHRGREVKQTGDGFMLAFVSPSSAVRFSIDLQRALAAEELGITVRIGINAGEPVAEEGDFFGAAVNVAARLCDRAGPGEILVSAAVAGLTLGKGFRFEEGAPIELRGFSSPLFIHRVEIPAD